MSNNIGIASSFLIHRGISKYIHPQNRNIPWKNFLILRQQVQTSSKNNKNDLLTIQKDDNSIVSSWLESGKLLNEDDNVVLKSVYETIQNVRNDYQRMLQEHTMKNNEKEFVLPKNEFRESLGVTKRLEMKLNNLAKNNDCPRCWMQRKHCICSQCPTIVSTTNTNNTKLPNIQNLFVMVHHKEIGLVVDTAKILYMAFPNTKCHIIINGIEPQYQKSMSLLQERFQSSIHKYNKTKKHHSCFVLFPSSDAVPFSQLMQQHEINLLESQQNPPSKLETQIQNDINTIHHETDKTNIFEDDNRWDVVVIDGTWAQANKIHSKIPTEIPRVCLSDEAVELLGTTGYQLRRHVIPWRQISTLEATRLLFRDMHPSQPQDVVKDEAKPWDILFNYQLIAKDAAKKQLGPPREKKIKK